MSTTSLRVTEIKFVSVISLCTLLWTLTPDGMTVTASNSIDLNYVVTTLEANTFRNGNSEHEYVFESSGTFECPTVPGLLSYSVLDAQGITGANPMSITGTYLLREVSTIFTVNQGSPVSSW